jgi:spermidine synthase
MTQAMALAFICGFVSLSLEVLWIRYFGFANQSTPYAFGYVLAIFLLGIAFGAILGKHFCTKNPTGTKLKLISGYWLCITGIFSIGMPVLYAFGYHTDFRNHIGFFAIFISSFGLSVIFPISHHLGVLSDSQNVGRNFSKVYCANVLGAALGPLFVGYIGLTYATTQTVFLLISALSLACASFFVATGSTHEFKLPTLFLSACISVLLLISIAPKFWLLDKVSIYKKPASTTIETRQGIVTIYKQENSGDIVLGGNVYDGRTNLDLEINSNGLNRPLLAWGIHKEPRRVLMIGLSIGSWLALIKELPGVEQIDVIEINPGYIEAASAYEKHSAALKDKRVKVHIDDARRWLRSHPQKQYDLIIMNTTYHWRSNITLLLSKEFLSVIQSRLLPGGLVAFNATGSPDALKTASVVFTTARRYVNFIFAADWDFTDAIKHPSTLLRYQQLKIDGKPAFTLDSKRPHEFLNWPLNAVGKDAKDYDRQLEVISDKNMITEFKFGRSF